MSTPMDLEITIISAKHLKNVNWENGNLTPYVVLTFSPNPRVSTKPDYSTKTDNYNNTKPVWNERFLIPFTSSRPLHYFTLQVFHSTFVAKTPAVDTLVGSVQVYVPNPVKDGKVYNYLLERPSGRPHGKIKIKFAVIPSSSPSLVQDSGFPPQVQENRIAPKVSNYYSSDPLQVQGHQFSPAAFRPPSAVPRPSPPQQSYLPPLPHQQSHRPRPPPQQSYQGPTPMPHQQLFNSASAPAYPPSVPRPPQPQQSYPRPPQPQQSYPRPPQPQQYSPKDPYYEAYCQGYNKCLQQQQQSYAGEPSAPIDYNREKNGVSARLAGAMKELALKEKVGKRVDYDYSESETEDGEYSDSCSVQPSAPMDFGLSYDGNRMRGSQNVGNKAGNGYGESRGYN